LSDLSSEILSGGPAGQEKDVSARPAAAAVDAAAADMAGLARTLFRWARQDGKLRVIPAVERQLIIEALAETRGNQVQAAKLLGITRATLRKRVEKFNIRQELLIK